MTERTPPADDPTARLVAETYDDLRRIARGMGGSETMQPTVIVHEAWLKIDRLTANRGRTWPSKRRFVRVFTRMMERAVVDYARRTGAAKRGGDVARIDIDPDMIRRETIPPHVLDVHDAITQFAAISPKKAELVRLRYFAGCTLERAAACLAMSLATAKRDWDYAKAWLRDCLQSQRD